MKLNLILVRVHSLPYNKKISLTSISKQFELKKMPVNIFIVPEYLEKGQHLIKIKNFKFPCTKKKSKACGHLRSENRNYLKEFY